MKKSKLDKEGLITPNQALVKVEKGELDGINIKDMIKQLKESSDIKEKLLSDLVKTLFDTENILMISRLSQDLAYYILKHLVIDGMYNQYYFNCSVTYVTERISVPPYYKVNVSYIYPSDEYRLHAYRNFINEILSIQVSLGGLGRQEVKDIVRALTSRLYEEEEKEKLLNRVI